MVIIDADVVSEMMRTEPNPQVVAWLSRQPVTKVHLTALSVAEILYGLKRMPEGKRRQDLEGRFQHVLETGFRGRVLAFDENAAVAYGAIMADRQAEGRPMSVVDGQIAAIAMTKGASLTTRNVKDFVGCGLELQNPFDD